MKGQCEAVSPLCWNSSKIQRVCRSPGASEAVASVNAEDALFFCRFQFAEMLGCPIQIRQVNQVVNTIPGCVITDSRNVYDKTASEVVCTRGSERRVDLELMALKHAQLRNGIVVRWVHSEAQLANSLTKNEQRQLQLWFSMQQRWRIVQDASMSSARRRKEMGKAPLEDGTRVNTEDLESNQNTWCFRVCWFAVVFRCFCFLFLFCGIWMMNFKSQFLSNRWHAIYCHKFNLPHQMADAQISKVQRREHWVISSRCETATSSKDL